MRNGLSAANIRLPTSAAVIGVCGQRAQVIAIDVKRLDALVVQVRNERLRKGRFSMAGLAGKPVDHV